MADELPLWIATDAGYFKKRGLDVDVQYLPAQEGIPALMSGQVQFAGIGGPDGISAEAQGTKLKLFSRSRPLHVPILGAAAIRHRRRAEGPAGRRHQHHGLALLRDP